MMKLVVVLACIFAVAYGQIELTAEEQNHLKTDPKCKIPCGSGETKNYSHPYDCTKYAECKNGVVSYKDCPTGYKFAPGVKACALGSGGAGQGCISCWLKRPEDY